MLTNLQVIQSTVWMKYRPLYIFLQRHASNVAHEIQRAYAATVRTYYETGFRRYLRGLGWIKACLAVFAKAYAMLTLFVGKDGGKGREYH